MESTAAKTEKMASMPESDFVYEAIKGAGKIGGYLQNILTDTIYCTGKCASYVWRVCAGLKDYACVKGGQEGKITIMRLMRNGTVIEEFDKKEFYMNFGKDLVEVTKSGLESENLTIIDVSKYGL